MYPGNIQVKNDTKFIDLRSDTVTRPCIEMRKLMAEAIVGDDVYGEDPTVNLLEERCAKMFGKEAGLFVVTGTMGNLISIMSHTMGRGEIVVGRTNHIQRWEQGGYARLAGVSAITLSVNNDGTMSLDELEEVCCEGNDHQAKTKLICLESTHNYSGGKTLSLDYLKKVREIADRKGVKIHLDGARVFNAAVKLGVTVDEIAKYTDSVQFCFSKGLGAPIGTVIVGTEDFIKQTRIDRKIVGGGWRQAGHLAAAANYALDNAYEWIKNDHEKALKVAKILNGFNNPKMKIDEDSLTNMILINVNDPKEAVINLQKHGINVLAFDDKRIRVVFHRNINDPDVDKIIDVFKQVFI